MTPRKPHHAVRDEEAMNSCPARLDAPPTRGRTQRPCRYWPTLGTTAQAASALTPTKQRTDGPQLHADQHTYNMLLRGLRCLGKRGMIS